MSLRQQHLRGLDGIRALAVLTVVAYHFGVAHTRGGFLGVDLFFVLSGFLITTLLLEERSETGSISLGAFWMRRARRLLPALFVMVGVVTMIPLVANRLGIILPGTDLHALRNSALASLGYVANWQAILAGHSYFTQFSAPSPLAHTWSLAIEEQFYMFWPLVTTALVAGGVALRRRRGVAVSLLLAVISTGLMALFFVPGSASSINRVYYGTDTRLFDLAMGAALAWFCVTRPVDPRARGARSASGGASLIVFALAVARAGGGDGMPSAFMFRGGFLWVAVAMVGLIVAVRDSEGFWHQIFAWPPLRAIGAVSYGIYLWHWPVVIFLTPQSVHLAGWRLLLLRSLLLSLVTVASYYLIEQPIRQRRWPQPWRRIVLVVATTSIVTSVFVVTVPQRMHEPGLAKEVARYAPTTPPTGSGGIVGLSASNWSRSQHFTASQPLRLGFYGDSLPYLAFAGIRKAFAATPHLSYYRQTFPGLDISDGRYKFLMLPMFTTFKPQVIVVMTRWDNDTAYAHPALYRSQLQEFLQWTRARGVKEVVFEGYPVNHTADFTLQSSADQAADNVYRLAADAAWRRVVLATVAANVGSTLYFPAQHSVELHGAFSAWLPPPQSPGDPRATWSRVRMNDGTHLCTLGTELFASALVWDLAEAFGLPHPSMQWWHGKWIYEYIPLLNAVGGTCTLDHPT